MRRRSWPATDRRRINEGLDSRQTTLVSELAVPLKSANAALGELVAAGVLVEHGTVQPSGRGRPSRLYTSVEVLGLTGSNPFRA